eukprot:TRINITY_DN96_c0_g1_i1.p1 TRINITY_DN96_c0_g1~~TRINITY_DN96_c0_g1_i1.p1  ORF type:complete len:779 (-),score=193.38 TRINITY_DN96_c0_g1_i1:269-2605(-)
MNSVLSNRIIDKINPESLRNLWRRKFNGLLKVNKGDLIKALVEEIKGEINLNDEEEIFMKMIISVFLETDEVRVQQVQNMFSQTEIKDWACNMLKFLDDDNEEKQMDEDRSHLIDNVIESALSNSGNLSRTYWLQNYKGRLFAKDKERFIYGFLEVIEECKTQNDKNLIRKELEENIIYKDKISIFKFAKLFEQDIIKFVTNTLRNSPSSSSVNLNDGWSNTLRGKNTKISLDNKSFSASGANYSCIMSHNSFKNGVHHFEFHIDKSSKNLFLGISSHEEKEKFNLDATPRSTDLVWIIGPKTIFNTKYHTLSTENFADVIEEQGNLGLTIDFDNKKVSFHFNGKEINFLKLSADIPLRVFACSNKETTLSIVNYSCGVNLQLPPVVYSPSCFASTLGKFDLVYWNQNYKGQNINLNENKTVFSTINLTTYENILSDFVFQTQNGRSSIFYVELCLEKVSEVYIGLCTSVEGDIDCEEEPRSDDKVWVMGPQTICNSIGEIEDNTPEIKFSQYLFVGLLIDMEKLTLSFFLQKEEDYLTSPPKVVQTFKNFPNSVRLFVSCSGCNQIELTHVINDLSYLDYVENKDEQRSNRQKFILERQKLERERQIIMEKERQEKLKLEKQRKENELTKEVIEQALKMLEELGFKDVEKNRKMVIERNISAIKNNEKKQTPLHALFSLTKPKTWSSNLTNVKLQNVPSLLITHTSEFVGNKFGKNNSPSQSKSNTPVEEDEKDLVLKLTTSTKFLVELRSDGEPKKPKKKLLFLIIFFKKLILMDF